MTQFPDFNPDYSAPQAPPQGGSDAAGTYPQFGDATMPPQQQQPPPQKSNTGLWILAGLGVLGLWWWNKKKNESAEVVPNDDVDDEDGDPEEEEGGEEEGGDGEGEEPADDGDEAVEPDYAAAAYDE